MTSELYKYSFQITLSMLMCTYKSEVAQGLWIHLEKVITDCNKIGGTLLATLWLPSIIEL